MSTNSKDFVTLSGVTKNFGNFRAIDNVSFGIRPGEVFGYIGPNGAGKTTTMKILVGLINPSHGEAYIGGYSTTNNQTQTHKLLGYLPQNVAFQDWCTVNQALKTFGKLSGLADTTVEQRIPEVLDLIGLADARHKKISHLSGGMIQNGINLIIKLITTGKLI